MSIRENLFVLIKPDGVRRGLVGKIISRFEKKGFHLLEMKMLIPEREVVEKHYEEHNSKYFFEDLVNFTLSGPVIAMVLSGNIQIARKMTGENIPWKCEVGTIRGDFSCCLRENVIHCSDSQESAKREIGLWFGDIK